MRGRVLAIAGSDSGGGAGIQADIRSIHALGGYPMTAITALTAQDTTAVHAVLPVPPGFVAAQMRCVLADLGADAIKTGMLASAATIEAVCAVLDEYSGIPLVVDPVMLSTSGTALLDPQAIAVLRQRLLPRARVLTPNIPEAEVLAAMPIRSVADMHAAVAVLLRLTPAVLLKGGHLPGAESIDLLATREGVIEFRAPRLATRHTHGTGCALASALATGLAQAMPLAAAVARARGFVRAAIATAPGLGAGHGPLDFGLTLDPARIAALSA